MTHTIHQEQQDYGLLVGTISRSGKKSKDFSNKELSLFFNATNESIEQLRAEEAKENFVREKKQIILPHTGHLISKFVEELGEIIGPTNTLFYRPDSHDIVEVANLKDKKEEYIFKGFKNMTPNRFITIIENFVVPGSFIKSRDMNATIFMESSMGANLARTVLESNILQNALPEITSIFTVPMPVMHNGRLTFPMVGYDPRFKSWLAEDSPTIDTSMDLETGKEIINKIFQEFCFKTEQDRTNAISALLTPFLRGLYNNKNARTPIFFYISNRERCGKDYCAGISGLLYEGQASEDAPITENEEIRKKLLSALIAGRKRLHFSNNKGFINSSALEGFSTATTWTDRVLGKSQNVSFINLIEISASGNVGITYTSDLANRCIFIKLHLDVEDANGRKFITPDLHSWIKNNRAAVLSALYSFVKNWCDKGMPKGSVPFTSFPEWATTCGGIMETAGYGNPSTTDPSSVNVGGDSETIDMKTLFEALHKKHGSEWVKRSDILSLCEKEELFSYYDFFQNSDKVKFGIKISKFIDRILSGLRLEVQDRNLRGSRQQYRLVKTDDGTVGTVGRFVLLENSEKNNHNNMGGNTMPTQPSLPAQNYSKGIKVNSFGRQIEE